MTVEYQRRLEKHYDELKWLYCELYHNDENAFDYFCTMLYDYYSQRNYNLKKLDRARMQDLLGTGFFYPGRCGQAHSRPVPFSAGKGNRRARNSRKCRGCAWMAFWRSPR